MAERRMFAKTIVLSDAFLDLPMSARCLYFTLGMLADDDGFVNAPRSIMRQCGASDDDMKLLLAKKFALLFDSGVIVIKHWRMANALRKDRYTPTVWQKEYAQLSLKENGAYTLNGGCQVVANGLPDGCPNISKDKITKDKLISSGDKHHHPTLEEVKAYCSERGNKVDPERWFDYYTSNGWKVGKNPMKDWKAAVRTWERGESKVKSRNTLLNYNETQTEVKPIELNLEEL